MTMLDETEVQKVFRARLQQTGGLPPPDHRIWENRGGGLPPEPEDSDGADNTWIEEWVRILSERKSSSGCIEAVGEYLWAVYVPKGRGTETLNKLSKAIADQFEAGQSLVATGLRAILERTSRSGVRTNPAHPSWVFKLVTIRWRVFTPASNNDL